MAGSERSLSRVAAAAPYLASTPRERNTYEGQTGKFDDGIWNSEKCRNEQQNEKRNRVDPSEKNYTELFV